MADVIREYEITITSEWTGQDWGQLDHFMRCYLEILELYLKDTVVGVKPFSTDVRRKT